MSASLSGSTCASFSHHPLSHVLLMSQSSVFFQLVKPGVCASSKRSGPQENTGKFLVAVLRNAGREVDLVRMHSRYAHLSLPLMLQRELF